MSVKRMWIRTDDLYITNLANIFIEYNQYEHVAPHEVIIETESGSRIIAGRFQDRKTAQEIFNDLVSKVTFW